VPTNLRVLPKNLSGQQVHDIMEQWAHSLGVRCDSCHSEDIDAVNQDERPRLNFADDSKPMKAVARIMYTMTDKINADYVAKVDGSGLPVTCGTCHRGEISPEPFTMQPPAQPQVAQAPSIGDEGPHLK
jgi:cytochrome c553